MASVQDVSSVGRGLGDTCKPADHRVQVGNGSGFVVFGSTVLINQQHQTSYKRTVEEGVVAGVLGRGLWGGG